MLDSTNAPSTTSAPVASIIPPPLALVSFQLSVQFDPVKNCLQPVLPINQSWTAKIDLFRQKGVTCDKIELFWDGDTRPWLSVSKGQSDSRTDKGITGAVATFDSAGTAVSLILSNQNTTGSPVTIGVKAHMSSTDPDGHCIKLVVDPQIVLPPS